MTGELNTALLTVAGIGIGATSGLIIGGFIGAVSPIANENRYMPKTVGAMKLVNGLFYGSAGLTMGVLVGGVSVHYIPTAIQSSALSSIKGLLIYGTVGFFTYKISKNFLHNVAEIKSSSLFAALFATGTVGLISQVR
jgi:hypothetical protein